MLVSFSCSGAASAAGTSTVKDTCQTLCNLRTRRLGKATVHPTCCSSTSRDSATVATQALRTSVTVTPSAVNSKSPARTCQLAVVLVVVSPSGVSVAELDELLDVLELAVVVDEFVVSDEDVLVD